MRTDHSWFVSRLQTIWRARPGRSCLLVVPPGCDTHATAGHVTDWILANDPSEEIGENRRALMINVPVDAASSSEHFAERLKRDFARELSDNADLGRGDYPADRIENLVESSQAEGRHPIFVFNRFHAFAAIADHQLLSVLATLRQLEHDGQLTTIAISPTNYQVLREQLSARGQFPFVNSAYGDNHDLVVIPPLTRAEFVAAAVEAGMTEPQAFQLFSVCGGPDAVHHALINAALSGSDEVVERAARSLNGKLEKFFDLAIGPIALDRDDLRLRVATGQLQPPHVAYLQHIDLSAFLLTANRTGGFAISSPVLARLLLVGREGPWVAYARVIESLDNLAFGEASRQAALLDRDTTNLEIFAGILDMLAAIHDSDRGGLLEIDWKSARKAGRRLLSKQWPLGNFGGWIDQIIGWADRVAKAVDSGQGPGSRLDVLIHRTDDADGRGLLLYAFDVFLGRVRRTGTPGEQVRAAGSVPESIMQAISVAVGLDPLQAPDTLPDLDYQRFFGGLGEYLSPEPGSKLDLTHLLVLVPALVEHRYPSHREEFRLCDASFVAPLHQKLVARLRNATAHTYAELDGATATFFFETCAHLLDDYKLLRQIERDAEFRSEPSATELFDLMSGRC